MADRYWVGGTGTWSGTNTANWSVSSGGPTGASVPTSADNVFFDSLSNTGTNAFTVTISTVTANCFNWDSTLVDGTLTVSGSQILNVFGSFSLKATQTTWSHSGGLNFVGTTSGLTINANGISLGTSVSFSGAGGSWTLASALTTTGNFNVTLGTFNSGNFAITCTNFRIGNSSSTRAVNLGSSTVTANGGFNADTLTGLTWNAGTSTFNFTTANTFISTNGLQMYDISITASVVGNNAFLINTPLNARNFTVVGLATTSTTNTRKIELSSGVNLTLSGTLTIAAGVDRATRTNFGTSKSLMDAVLPVTISAAAYSLNDVNLHGVTFTGAGAPATGTSISDLGKCSGVTFTAPKTVYKVSATTTWLDAIWATGSNGTGSKANYPLGQDTIIIDNNSGAGLTQPSSTADCTAFCMFDASLRTTAFTLTTQTNANIYSGGTNGGWKSNANLTISGGSNNEWFTMGTGTFTIDLPTAAYSWPIFLRVAHTNGGSTRIVNSINNTFAATSFGVSIYAGTLDLDGKILRWSGRFVVAGNNAWAKNLTYGAGGELIINSTTFQTTGILSINGTNYTVTADSVTGLRPITYTGTAAITVTTFGSGTSAIIEGNAPDLILSATGMTSINGNLTTRHFIATALQVTTFDMAANIFGDFKLGAGIGTIVSNSQWTLESTSATVRDIQMNGEVLQNTVLFSGVGGKWRLLDNLTTVARLQLTTGSVDLNGFVATARDFSAAGFNTRNIDFSTPGSRIDLTGNATTVFSYVANGMTFTGSSNFNFTYTGATGTRTLSGTTSGMTATNQANITIAAGSDTVIVESNFGSVNFSGGTFTGTLASSSRVVNTMRLKTGMTYLGGATTMTQYPGETGYLNLAGLTHDGNLIISTDGTTELESAITTGTTRTVSITRGIFKTNNFALTSNAMTTTGTLARTINLGSSTITVQSFDFAAPTNLTFLHSGAVFNLNPTVSVTCQCPGAGFVFPKINLASVNRVTLGSTNNVEFIDFTNSVTPADLTLNAFDNPLVRAFNLNGTPGNLVKVRGLYSFTASNMLKNTAGDVSCDYLDIEWTTVTGTGAGTGAKWYAGANSFNRGNNNGWIFTAPPVTASGKFFQLMNWA